VNSKKLKSALWGVALALGLASAPASALTWYFPITSFEDNDLDFVVDTNSNGIIDVGDRLVSVLEFQTTEGILAGQGPTSILPQELTAVADLTVVGISATGQLIFGASGATGVLSGFAAGTTVALWIDSTPDLDVINSNCGTRAQCLVLAGLGGADAGSSLFMTIGFFGDADALWVSTPLAGGTIISTVQGGSSSQSFGAFSYSQQIGINNTGQIFGLQPCAPFCGIGGNGLIQVTGSGQILGGQGLTASEWTARSDNDAQVAPLQVPEPGSLVLLGAALLAAASVGARRKN
jgi:hypothetical protein